MWKVFIFDLDDTLMWNEYTYSLAFEKFYSFLMRAWKRRIPYIGSVARLAEDLNALMVKEINPATGKEYGFSMDRFPSSLVRCYKALCETGYGVYDEKIAHCIYGIGMTAFDSKNYKKHGFAPWARYALNFLRKQNDVLILVTKGDPRVQQRKIDALCLERWFSEIHIVENKPPELFAEFRNRFSGTAVLSVGNSFSSDIKPALQAGVKGIFIPYYTWKAESIDREGYDQSSLIVLQSIKQIVPLYKSGQLDKGGER